MYKEFATFGQKTTDEKTTDEETSKKETSRQETSGPRLFFVHVNVDTLFTDNSIKNLHLNGKLKSGGEVGGKHAIVHYRFDFEMSLQSSREISIQGEDAQLLLQMLISF